MSIIKIMNIYFLTVIHLAPPISGHLQRGWLDQVTVPPVEGHGYWLLVPPVCRRFDEFYTFELWTNAKHTTGLLYIISKYTNCIRSRAYTYNLACIEQQYNYNPVLSKYGDITPHIQSLAKFQVGDNKIFFVLIMSQILQILHLSKKFRICVIASSNLV